MKSLIDITDTLFVAKGMFFVFPFVEFIIKDVCRFNLSAIGYTTDVENSSNVRVKKEVCFSAQQVVTIRIYACLI